MLSFESLDRGYLELWPEAFVLGGDPGRRQMKIRARVAPFPYRQSNRNETFDVETIARPTRN